MNNNGKFAILRSVGFFILGLMLFIKPDVFVKFISYILGTILIVVGIYRTLNYYIQNKRTEVVNSNEIAFGITAIVLGIVFIFLADAIELLLRFIVGIWVIFAGLGKIMQTFYTTDRGSKFYSLLVMGIVLIGVGLYIVLVSNLALSVIGLFIVLYAIIDFVSYFVFSPKTESQATTVKVIESSEVIEGDATYKEEKTTEVKEEKKETTKSKKKGTKAKKNK